MYQKVRGEHMFTPKGSEKNQQRWLTFTTGGLLLGISLEMVMISYAWLLPIYGLILVTWALVVVKEHGPTVLPWLIMLICMLLMRRFL